VIGGGFAPYKMLSEYLEIVELSPSTLFVLLPSRTAD
jgi:hypothetical protein